MFRTLILLTVLSGMVYFGAYGEIEGLRNISFVGLWIFTVFLFLVVMFNDSAAQPTKNKNVFVRLWFFALVLTCIYGGLIAIGVIWIVSLFIARGRKAASAKKEATVVGEK